METQETQFDWVEQFTTDCSILNNVNSSSPILAVVTLENGKPQVTLSPNIDKSAFSEDITVELLSKLQLACEYQLQNDNHLSEYVAPQTWSSEAEVVMVP